MVSPGDKWTAEMWEDFKALVLAGYDSPDGGSLTYFRRMSFVNHVIGTGGIASTSPNLITTITPVDAYINGKLASHGLDTHAYPASKDTYVDMLDDGSFLYPNTTNGGTAPALSTNVDGSPALRLCRVNTNATTVNGVVHFGLDSFGNYIHNMSPTAAPITVFTNAGTAGGQFFSRSQNGIKEVWGKTGAISVSGAGFQSSASKSIFWPFPFFNVAPSVTMHFGQVSNSQYLGLTTITEPDLNGMTIQLLQTNGSNGAITGAFLHARGF